MGKKRTEKNAKISTPSAPKPAALIPRRTFHWKPLILVLAVTFVVFLPSLSNDFVNWDDDINVYENKNIQGFDWPHVQAIFASTVIGGYNPLSILTFAIEKHFFGLNPRAFHIDNLALHLVCVFFVYYLLLLLKLSPRAAGFGA